MKRFKFIKKFPLSEDDLKIVGIFLIWRIGLFLFAFIGVSFVPLRGHDFFGGGLENYSQHPLVWGWANFDGEHYLSIAQNGYKSLQYAFFPLFPLIISFLTLFSKDLFLLGLSGLFVSSVAFLISLLVFFRLVKSEYSQEVAWSSVISLVLFPTSFYFGSVYTESLFLVLTLTSFYLALKGRWFLAGLFGIASSASRIFGMLLFPSFLTEAISQKKKVFSGKAILGILLIPLGLLAYMYFLERKTGDPLAFYHILPLFGEQRGTSAIFLPQVFWRALKILIQTDKSNVVYFTFVMEFLTGVLVILALVFGFLKKVRPAYFVYLLLSLILATITGSFSGLPRYMIVSFPLFIIIGLFLTGKGRTFRLSVYLFSILLLILNTALFIRGYWVE